MSAARRGATGLSGILLVDKPEGMTSHDVVAIVRRATGEGRVGHAGTLDPGATGLLVILVGPATRLEPYLSSATKSYEATIVFGSATDTDDAEGATIATSRVPDEVGDPAYAEALLTRLLGESQQMPPVYSAIKTDGKAAHRVARAGGEVAVRPRPIRVDEARLLGVDPATVSWSVAFTVSKGTYIRALARDVGLAANTHAHLGGLVRTGSGALLLSDAHSIDDVTSHAESRTLDQLWADPIDALGLPVVETTAEMVADGRPLRTESRPDLAEGELAAVVDVDSRALLAVYRHSSARLVPVVVIPGGVARGAR